jgi:Na+-driven multidrug efflux pump
VLLLFTTAEALIAGATGPLMVVVVAVLLAVPGEAMYASVVGTGDTLAVLAIQMLISVCVLGAAYYAALVLELPLAYVWLAEVLGWTMCLASAGLDAQWLLGPA